MGLETRGIIAASLVNCQSRVWAIPGTRHRYCPLEAPNETIFPTAFVLSPASHREAPTPMELRRHKCDEGLLRCSTHCKGGQVRLPFVDGHLRSRVSASTFDVAMLATRSCMDITDS